MSSCGTDNTLKSSTNTACPSGSTTDGEPLPTHRIQHGNAASVASSSLPQGSVTSTARPGSRGDDEERHKREAEARRQQRRQQRQRLRSTSPALLRFTSTVHSAPSATSLRATISEDPRPSTVSHSLTPPSSPSPSSSHLSFSQRHHMIPQPSSSPQQPRQLQTSFVAYERSGNSSAGGGGSVGPPLFSSLPQPGTGTVAAFFSSGASSIPQRSSSSNSGGPRGGDAQGFASEAARTAAAAAADLSAGGSNGARCSELSPKRQCSSLSAHDLVLATAAAAGPISGGDGGNAGSVNRQQFPGSGSSILPLHCSSSAVGSRVTSSSAGGRGHIHTRVGVAAGKGGDSGGGAGSEEAASSSTLPRLYSTYVSSAHSDGTVSVAAAESSLLSTIAKSHPGSLYHRPGSSIAGGGCGAASTLGSARSSSTYIAPSAGDFLKTSLQVGESVRAVPDAAAIGGPSPNVSALAGGKSVDPSAYLSGEGKQSWGSATPIAAFTSGGAMMKFFTRTRKPKVMLPRDPGGTVAGEDATTLAAGSRLSGSTMSRHASTYFTNRSGLVGSGAGLSVASSLTGSVLSGDGASTPFTSTAHSGVLSQKRSSHLQKKKKGGLSSMFTLFEVSEEQGMLPGANAAAMPLTLVEDENGNEVYGGGAGIGSAVFGHANTTGGNREEQQQRMDGRGIYASTGSMSDGHSLPHVFPLEAYETSAEGSINSGVPEWVRRGWTAHIAQVGPGMGTTPCDAMGVSGPATSTKGGESSRGGGGGDLPHQLPLASSGSQQGPSAQESHEGGGGSGEGGSGDEGSGSDDDASSDDVELKHIRFRYADALYLMPWDQRLYVPTKGAFHAFFTVFASPRFWEKLDWAVRVGWFTVLPTMILTLEPATQHIFPIPSAVANLACWITMPTFGSGLREFYFAVKGYGMCLVLLIITIAIAPGSSFRVLVLMFFETLIAAFVAEECKSTAAYCLCLYMMQYITDPVGTGFKWTGDYFITLLIALGFGLAAFVIPFIRWSSDIAEHYITVYGNSVSCMAHIAFTNFWSGSLLQREHAAERLRQLQSTVEKCAAKVQVSLKEVAYEPHNGAYEARLHGRFEFLSNICGIVTFAAQVVQLLVDKPEMIDSPTCISFGEIIQDELESIVTAVDAMIVRISNFKLTVFREDIEEFQHKFEHFQQCVQDTHNAVIRMHHHNYTMEESSVLLGFFLFSLEELCDVIGNFSEEEHPRNNLLYKALFFVRDVQSAYAAVRNLVVGFYHRRAVTRRFKEALKMALCMFLVGVFQVYALSNSPTSVAAGAAMIGQLYSATGGESFQYATQRLMGTVLGSVTSLMAVQIANKRHSVLYVSILILASAGGYVQAAPGYYLVGNTILGGVISVITAFADPNAAMVCIQQNVFASLLYFIVTFTVWPARSRTSVRVSLDMSLRFFRAATCRLLRNMAIPELSDAVQEDVMRALDSMASRIASMEEHLPGAVSEPTVTSTEFPQAAWEEVALAQKRLHNTVSMMRFAYKVFMLPSQPSTHGRSLPVHVILLRRMAADAQELSALVSVSVDLFLMSLASATVVSSQNLTQLRHDMGVANRNMFDILANTVKLRMDDVLGKDDSSSSGSSSSSSRGGSTDNAETREPRKSDNTQGFGAQQEASSAIGALASGGPLEDTHANDNTKNQGTVVSSLRSADARGGAARRKSDSDDSKTDSTPGAPPHQYSISGTSSRKGKKTAAPAAKSRTASAGKFFTFDATEAEKAALRTTRMPNPKMMRIAVPPAVAIPATDFPTSSGTQQQQQGFPPLSTGDGQTPPTTAAAAGAVNASLFLSPGVKGPGATTITMVQPTLRDDWQHSRYPRQSLPSPEDVLAPVFATPIITDSAAAAAGATDNGNDHGVNASGDFMMLSDPRRYTIHPSSTLIGRTSAAMLKFKTRSKKKLPNAGGGSTTTTTAAAGASSTISITGLGGEKTQVGVPTTTVAGGGGGGEGGGGGAPSVSTAASARNAVANFTFPSVSFDEPLAHAAAAIGSPHTTAAAAAAAAMSRSFASTATHVLPSGTEALGVSFATTPGSPRVPAASFDNLNPTMFTGDASAASLAGIGNATVPNMSFTDGNMSFAVSFTALNNGKKHGDGTRTAGGGRGGGGDARMKGGKATGQGQTIQPHYVVDISSADSSDVSVSTCSSSSDDDGRGATARRGPNGNPYTQKKNAAGKPTSAFMRVITKLTSQANETPIQAHSHHTKPAQQQQQKFGKGGNKNAQAQSQTCSSARWRSSSRMASSPFVISTRSASLEHTMELGACSRDMRRRSGGGDGTCGTSSRGGTPLLPPLPRAQVCEVLSTASPQPRPDKGASGDRRNRRVFSDREGTEMSPLRLREEREGATTEKANIALAENSVEFNHFGDISDNDSCIMKTHPLGSVCSSVDVGSDDDGNGEVGQGEEIAVTYRDLHSIQAFLFGIAVLVKRVNELQKAVLDMQYASEMAKKL